MRRYWRLNWDYWFLIGLMLLIAIAIGGILGAVGDTIDQIRSGY